MFWLLIWFTVVPDVGVRYHHLGVFSNETQCMSALRMASVLVNSPTETIECIGVANV